MTSPANVLAPSTQVVDKRAPSYSSSSAAHRSTGNPAEEVPAGRLNQKSDPGETANATPHPGVLGSSLQRLYDFPSSTGIGPSSVASRPQYGGSSEAIPDLTESLLEAVFEISEFDPLPHLNYREEEFGFGLFAGSPHYSPPAKGVPSTNRGAEVMPGSGQSQLSPAPNGQSGMDRRKLPRRESDCIVSVCRCRAEERLTGERITWMLHATKLKGQLFDVSMSGVAFHLMESLAAGSKILLRISNRTLDKQVDTTATILRSRAANDGGWNVVCRFDKNLTFEQIHTVGRSLFAATIV
jgi:hypothetical protein